MTGANRVALVTGSSGEVGAAVALTLARAGHDIVVNYSHGEARARATLEACDAAGSNSLLAQCDVSDEEAVIAMIAAISEEYGRLDVVCSNAGTSSKIPPAEFDSMTVEEWDRIFAVNVRGLFLIAKHTKPLLLKADNPSLIVTASIVGMRPGPQPLPYSASKAAVISMTQTLCRALGPRVRVNAVAPGWIAGKWMKDMLGDNYDRLMERRARMTPRGRVATPDDVAAVVLSLAVDLRFVSGETIVVDGGLASTT